MRQFDILVYKLLEVQINRRYGVSTHPNAGTLGMTPGDVALMGVFNVDKQISSGYFYPIQICRDVKKAGHVDPLSLDIECVTTLCVRYATTEPVQTWNIMDVIKPYRRSHLRLSIYLLLASQPAGLLQPVLHFDRGPPIPRTHYG